MGELGNVSNASAGYCGTNMVSGIESCWRYIKRDTIGTAGTNMGMSLEVFAPSLVKHMSDMTCAHVRYDITTPELMLSRYSTSWSHTTGAY